MPPAIYFLTGPTAVGKTAMALRWAREHGAEIVNADALLFYRGMDIGTAKPTAAEQTLVPHHLIDIVPASEPMSIKRYAQMAGQIVREIIEVRKRPVLVTGGSGFYLKSFFEPVVDAVEPEPQIRAVVNELEQQGLPALLSALRKASPAGMGKVHLQNPRRVARALERCLITGKSIPELEGEFAALPRPFAAYRKRLCLLLAPNEVLHPRIEARTAAMLQGGLIDEVRTLLANGIEGNPPAATAIGYRETIAYLTGRTPPASLSALPAPATEQELGEQINLNTRRLVAKQRKWFRNQVKPDGTLTRTGNDEGTLYAALCECFTNGCN